MKNKKLKLNDFQLKVTIRALNDLRNNLISEEKNTIDVDELLLLFIEVLEK